MIRLVFRWLAIAALLIAVPAQAQVFKPGKSTTSGSSDSSSQTTSSSGSAKKSSSTTKKASASSKKSSKKKKGGPKVDPDYVKIIDDDDE
jgi:hypothetical protein